MKVQKSTKDKHTCSLAQKLEAYKATHLGVALNNHTNAIVFAAGSLSVLTPFISQAQTSGVCRTGLPIQAAIGLQFDVNNDGINDISFQSIKLMGTQLFSAAIRPLNAVQIARPSYAYAAAYISNAFISKNAIFIAGGKAQLIKGGTGGPFFNSSNKSFAIRLISGELGFVKLNTMNNKIIITSSGVGLNANASIKAGSCASLPVELTEFVAKAINDHTVSLHWNTASEINNNHFDIERSSDGKKFQVIGQVKGNGTTQVSHDYQFTDAQLAAEGIYYYRLNQINNEGSSEYSPVVSVAMAGVKVKVYPTVIHNRLNILSASNTLPVTVIDMTGRILREFNHTPESIDVSDLGAGVYLVRVGNEIVRVVKAN